MKRSFDLDAVCIYSIKMFDYKNTIPAIIFRIPELRKMMDALHLAAAAYFLCVTVLIIIVVEAKIMLPDFIVDVFTQNIPLISRPVEFLVSVGKPDRAMIVQTALTLFWICFLILIRRLVLVSWQSIRVLSKSSYFSIEASKASSLLLIVSVIFGSACTIITLKQAFFIGNYSFYKEGSAIWVNALHNNNIDFVILTGLSALWVIIAYYTLISIALLLQKIRQPYG